MRTISTGEDDDMWRRIANAGLNVSRYPANIARYLALKHNQQPLNEDRYTNVLIGSNFFDSDGLSDLKY